MSRIPGRNFLFVPGPTNVPDRVQRAMAVAMEDHRSSRFPDLSTSVLADLKKVYKTEEGQVFIFPSSGTGAWEAAGLDLCAKEPKWYSDTVSAVMVPEGVNAAHVIDVAFRRYNLALGAGLSKVAGKLFRIGHLGDLNELMLMGAIAGAEMAMLDVGVEVTPGSGVAAASEYWRNNDRVPKRKVGKAQQFYAGHSTGTMGG